MREEKFVKTNPTKYLDSHALKCNIYEDLVFPVLLYIITLQQIGKLMIYYSICVHFNLSIASKFCATLGLTNLFSVTTC